MPAQTYLLGFLCFIFLGASSLFAQPALCFQIENERTVTHPTLGSSYAFDVSMYASYSGTYHSRGQVYLSYDTTKFGSSVNARNNIAIEHEALLQGIVNIGGQSTPKYSTINVVDNQDSRVVIAWQSNFLNFLPNPLIHDEVPDTLTKLYTIYLKIANTPSAGDVNVFLPLTANQQFFITDVNGDGIPDEVPYPYGNCNNKPVFPGDANFNQHCNYTDFLYLGIAFGETGLLRPNASLSWTPQYGPNWADTLPNGRNMKHADCDGDGTVGFADTVAINLNYGMTHTFNRGGRASGNVPLFLTTKTPVFSPGDTVTFEIHLGTIDSMANDIYGLGFSVGYDTSQVEPEKLWVNYAGSWLGDKNQDMITLQKDFFADGKVDIALTRINHMDRSGHGKIADLIIVIDDDLYKRSMPFELTITESFAWSDEAEEIVLEARDGQFNIDPVFPGDANFNQHCNYTDLLYLGIAFGETGPVRPNASLSWTPQYGPNWADTLPNGRNMKHADGDGDGTVSFADTVAINQNYQMSHTLNRGGRASGNVPLFLTTATPVFFPGDTVTFEIHLGTMDSMANDIYGLGFSLGYDTSQVEPEMLWVNYAGSWLGDKNQDMITLHKDFFADGKVDIAWTRINQMDRNGHGKIADLIIVIDDNLYQRSMPFELIITESFAWTDEAEEIVLQVRDGQFSIEDPNTAIQSLLEHQLSISPIPAQSHLQLHHPAARLLAAKLYDLQGKRQVTSLEISSSRSQLNWGNLPAGFYLLEMTFEEGKLVKKIVIR